MRFFADLLDPRYSLLLRLTISLVVDVLIFSIPQFPEEVSL